MADRPLANMPRQCGTCDVWRKLANVDAGHCHRHPPVPIFVGLFNKHQITGQPSPIVDSYFPITMSGHFCGDYMPASRVDLGNINFEEALSQ